MCTSRHKFVTNLTPSPSQSNPILPYPFSLADKTTVDIGDVPRFNPCSNPIWKVLHLPLAIIDHELLVVVDCLSTMDGSQRRCFVV